MSKYIETDKLLGILAEEYFTCSEAEEEIIIRIMRKAKGLPTNDVTPVKRGEWKDKRIGTVAVTAKCPFCDAFVTWDADSTDFAGCPFCLADLRETEDES